MDRRTVGERECRLAAKCPRAEVAEVFVDRDLSQKAGARVSVLQVLRQVGRHPIETIGRRWNWKSALLSSLIRAAIFFCVNLTAGLRAAEAALVTELTFRGAASGFYGALTEAFRFAEPEWAASLVAMILLPLTGHSVELLVHLLRGTVRLKTSILASIGFTSISTLFNLYAMRRGALITGEGQQSLGADMKRMPRLIAGFLASGPLALRPLLARAVRTLARPALPVRPAAQESPD
jgi:hypothetical protein